jgi:hypothetical protein
MDRFSEQTKACMQALLHCHSVCLSTGMTRYLEASHEHKRPQHLRLILDCAAVCILTSDLLAHKSQFHARFCALCAEVCETCFKDCQQLGGLEDCAEACRSAASHCRETAKLEHREILELASRLPPEP